MSWSSAARSESASPRCSTMPPDRRMACWFCGRRGSSPSPSCRSRACISCCARCSVAIERLPEAQSAALRAAIGIDGGTAERFLVSVAVLGVLAELAEERPLLAIVDDAQWLDRASAEALVFAARRLQADDAALLFAVRDGEQSFPGAGLREVVLRGVDAAASGAVIDERGDRELSPELRRRVISEAAGNPLALIELPRALTEPDPTAPQTGLSRLPLTEELQRAFLARVRTLPEPVQALLLLAACDDSRELTAVRRPGERSRSARTRLARPSGPGSCPCPTGSFASVTHSCDQPSISMPPRPSASAPTRRWPTHWTRPTKRIGAPGTARAPALTTTRPSPPSSKRQPSARRAAVATPPPYGRSSAQPN